MNKVTYQRSKRLVAKKEHRLARNDTALELERFKRCLFNEHRSATLDSQVRPWLNRAADEAASIAWATPYPLLVLPVLLEEKLKDAERKAELQEAIYTRSHPIVALAV